WIVMKALEKDRNRRYETANAFAMDVQRYLADEPVQAGPPSAWYRLQKVARRDRGRLAGGAGLGVVVVGAGGVASGCERRAGGRGAGRGTSGRGSSATPRRSRRYSTSARRRCGPTVRIRRPWSWARPSGGRPTAARRDSPADWHAAGMT